MIDFNEMPNTFSQQTFVSIFYRGRYSIFSNTGLNFKNDFSASNPQERSGGGCGRRDRAHDMHINSRRGREHASIQDLAALGSDNRRSSLPRLLPIFVLLPADVI